MNIKLTCESTVDIPHSQLKDRDIDYLPFHFYIDGKEYIDDLGETLSYRDFYEMIDNGASTKTTQANITEYICFFEKWLIKGYDILHLTLSTGLSGTYNNAILAKEELKKKYPNNKIYVVDSLAASSGFGMLMDTLADYRDKGYTLEELYNLSEDII